DGVDGGAAAPGGGVVEDVVVDERADLHELDRGGRVDDPVVEHVAGGGSDDGEQRAQALAAGRHDPLGGGAERRPVAPDGRGPPRMASAGRSSTAASRSGRWGRPKWRASRAGERSGGRPVTGRGRLEAGRDGAGVMGTPRARRGAVGERTI